MSEHAASCDYNNAALCARGLLHDFPVRCTCGVEEAERFIAPRFVCQCAKEIAMTARPSIQLVREFHAAFDQPDADAPNVGDETTNQLRIALLQEELFELQDALDARDPVAVLDALTDLQYVLDGSYLQLGFAAVKDAALAEVHRSNMSKLGDDGKPVRREDGKIMKGPRYSKPDLAAVLAMIDERRRQ